MAGEAKRVRGTSPLSVMLTPEQRATIDAAAGLAEGPMGGSPRERTVSAWARRVLLREAARLHAEGE